MMRADVVYDVPTWLSGLAIVLLAMLGSLIVQIALHRFASVEFRERHTAAVTAIFSIIGITYAVLLAFVAMLTWEGFNRARAATFEEAGAVAELHRLTEAMPESTATALRAALDDYVRSVVEIEWPAQTGGHLNLSGERWLRTLHATIGAERPVDPGAANVQAQFLAELAALSAARQGRLLSVQATVPAVVWVVVLAGGALLVLFSSLLGAQSYRLHLLMTALLTASGAMVIVLIVSLDNPFRSDFRISPAAYSIQSGAAEAP